MNASHLPPAPGSDEHISIALINTAHSVPGNQELESLEDPQAATDWLIEHQLVPGDTQLLEYCHGKLTNLRAQLRKLSESRVNNQAPDKETLAQVNAAIRTAPQTLTLEYLPDKGFIQTASHPVTQLVDHALARIAEDAAALLSSDESSALEECGAPSCNRIFLRTHARRHWCSTRCGDRVRAARAYAKKKQAAST